MSKFDPLIGKQVMVDPTVEDNESLYGEAAMGTVFTVKTDNLGTPYGRSNLRMIEAIGPGGIEISGTVARFVQVEIKTTKIHQPSVARNLGHRKTTQPLQNPMP